MLKNENNLEEKKNIRMGVVEAALILVILYLGIFNYWFAPFPSGFNFNSTNIFNVLWKD